MARLMLHLLGGPRIEVDGKPIEIDRRKAIALLVYLAVTGQSHSRDALATLLWPDYDQTRARAYLRQTLWTLNKALTQGELVIDREIISLDQQAEIWLDVDQFHRHLTECRQHGHPVDEICPACLIPLTEAAALYHDDFLAGFTLPDSPEFDEWQYFQTEGLRRELTSTLEKLVRSHQARNEFEPAIAYGRHWLTLEPLHEPIHRHLMELYARLGQQAAALRQYETCRHNLAEELGVEPAAETTALRDQILRGEIDVLPPPSPLRSHNLPTLPTSLIGREKEIDQLQQLLCRQDVRLVTITGPPGIGKTRLGLQVAANLIDEFSRGVFFVSLAPISDSGLVISIIAQTLGVREEERRSLVERVKEHLRDKQTLLLLDNFEQVVLAAPLVAELLATCPRLKVLVTSREVLHLSGEHEFPVSPLALPDPVSLPPVETLARYEAVALFIQRARAVKPNFGITEENAPVVAEICVHLDGLPLAIELAAARIKLMSPQAMLSRLEERFKLLRGGTRDMPGRHQTLRRAIAWSYDLLDSAEQVLFQRLAVFVGGCTLRVAEVVCHTTNGLELDVLEGVASLLDKSLLQPAEQADSEPRFFMLETIREYGLERLAANGEEETTAAHQAHAAYYLNLAEQAETKLSGPDQLGWLKRLELEHDNLRAAIRWSKERGEIETGLRLGGALSHFWAVRGYYEEGQEQLAGLLAQSDSLGYTPARAKALHGAGLLAKYQSDFPTAQLRYEESLAIRRALGDRQGAAKLLNNLGVVAYRQGDDTAARSFWEESLIIKRELGNNKGIALSLNNLGVVAYEQGDYPAAHSYLDESLVIWQELGDRHGLAMVLDSLGNLAHIQGDYTTARRLFEESLHTRWALVDRGGIVEALESLARLAATQNQPQRAYLLAGAATALRQAIGAPPSPTEQVRLEPYLEKARQALDEEVADKAFADGQAMTLEQAVKYALAKTARDLGINL